MCNQETKKQFDELISLNNGHIRVNWKIFCEDNVNMYDILSSLDIFSLAPENSYAIIFNAGGVILNPRSMLGIFVLFFTREEDAIEYARINLSGTLYYWSIIHIDHRKHTDKTLSKKEVLGEN